MIAPDAAFANAADAAAAAFAATPPYVSYRIDVRSVVGSGEKTETDLVVLRTSDGAALVRGPAGETRMPAPPVLPAAIDGLAEWAFAPQTVDGHVVLHVNYEEPKRYAFSTPGPGVDAVVPSISGFRVGYAPGASDHVQLAPSTQDVEALAAQPDRFLYRDVWFDPASWLPTRIVVAAVNGSLALDYADVGGHWLLTHARYDASERSRHGAQRTVIDAAYSNYAFPAAFAAGG